MLKTEMLLEPWSRTNRNWPPEFTPTLIGLAPTGDGGTAVPTGVRIPEVWLRLKPETVLEVELATYTKFFEVCSARATGIGLVANGGTENEESEPSLPSLSPKILFEPWPAT